MKLISAKLLLVVILYWCTMGMFGCSMHQNRADYLAAEAGFSRKIIAGKQFEHVTYLHGIDTQAIEESHIYIEELHIYIEGDGTPWVNGRYPSLDPTPRRPLALKLMAEDPAPAIYLGRPCYFGLSSSANCSAEFWTGKRYSPEVVASMLSVVQYYQQAYGAKKIVLIGYSGGGTLATLLARELPGEVFLITLGANLDTDLWTELRGFLPLDGSLNPMHYRTDTAHKPQLHLAGMRDKIVPIAVIESYVSELDPQFSRYYPAFNHACCWLELWPEIIAERPWSGNTRK